MHSTTKIHKSYLFGLLLIYAIMMVSCDNGKTPEGKKEKYMDAAAIERLIAHGNYDVTDRENLARIEKKEYPFIGKYLTSSDKRIKDVALSFLRSINQPWCYRWYVSVLGDSDPQIRAGAGDGILQLKTVGNVNELLSNIEKESEQYAGDEAAMQYLIKAIGNIGKSDHVIQLKEIVNSVNTDGVEKKKIQEALLAACAKLNDSESVHLIEKWLEMGSSVERMKALEIVEYTEQSNWIHSVVPLLLDKSEAMSFEIGPNKVIKRVCDYAANTLLHIDSPKKLTIEPLGPFPYTDQEIEEVKKLYGISDWQ
jgi:hypothetical protein